MNTSDAEQDDIERDLEALLAGANPSTTFAAAVRTRVAEDAAARSHRAAYSWALGGAVCLSSLVWALTARPTAVPSVASASTAVSAALGAAQVPREQLAPNEPRAETKGLQGRRGRVDARASAPSEAVVGAEASDSRVLVPDDQRIALVNLLHRLHQGRATVPVSVVPAYDEDGLLVPLELIVIAPLPDPVPPDSPSGNDEGAGGGRVEPGKAGRDKQR